MEDQVDIGVVEEPPVETKPAEEEDQLSSEELDT
jgi:hypothetical protein